MSDPVAITGLGIVCSLGASSGAVAAAAREGRRPFAPVRRFDASQFRVNLAAEAVEIDAAGRFGERFVRRTSRTDRLAAWAFADAVAQADLGAGEIGNAGLYVGASSAGMAELEAAVGSDGEPGFWQYWSYPIWVTSSWLARQFGVGGVRTTFMTACSSSAHALGIAMRRVRAGAEEIAVAGGAESICRLTLSGFGSLGVLDPHGARPFDAGRNGITLGEGAAFFVLESAARAERRGARPLALLAGYGLAAEAHHMVHPLEDGSGALAAIRGALRDAGLRADQVDYVNAHGTGTRQNDAMEARALAAELGAGTRVSSSKGMLGHALGAAGALEAALTVLGMTEGFVPPSAGVKDPAPELGDLCLVTSAVAEPPGMAVSSSFAFGGNNAALVLVHPEARPPASHAARPRPLAPIVVTAAAVACRFGTACEPERLARLLDADPGAASRELADLDPVAILGHSVTRRMDRLSAAATALFATVVERAGLTDLSRAALSFGTSFGALDATARFLERLFAKGAHLVNPLEFPNLVHSAPAGHAAIRLGARGPSLTADQEELSGDDALLTMLDLMADGDATMALIGGGDLASDWLDRGYAAIDRVVGTASSHASLVGALVIEAAGRRDVQPWARIVGTGAAGPRNGVAGAVGRAFEQAQSAGHRLETVDLWCRGATERHGQTHEAQAQEHPLLCDRPAVDVRRILGDAGGGGVAVVAIAAAAVAVGRARTALVTSVTRDGSARAVLLGKAG